MAKLNDNVKAFIVTRLACFETPSCVSDAVRQEFGLEVPRNRIHKYDPEGCRGDRLSAKWRDLFYETRGAFVENVQKIPIANYAYRLSRLDHMARKAERMGNLDMAAKLIEQAAKECGGMFTNRREISGPEGAPIEMRTIDARRISDEALEELMAARHDSDASQP